MTSGFYANLTPEQQKRALNYRGPENHGDPMYEDEENWATVPRFEQERNILTQAIADAALKAGIYNGEVELTGPHLLMLLDDMADVILLLDKEVQSQTERIERLVNDLATKEFGNDETMFRALEAIIARSHNIELGTSKVIDMRKLAEKAIKEVSEKV